MSPLVLTEEECGQDRTPDELYAWLFEKMDLFHSLSCDDPNLNRELLLHEGLAKQFYEEIYPLAMFTKHYYGGRTDVCVKWVPGNQNHDALISDQGGGPVFVEITQTCFDRQERCRWESILQKRPGELVSLIGEVQCEGTERKGRKITVTPGFKFIAGEKLLEESRKRVGKALDKKGRKPRGHYHSNTVLVVLVADFFWGVGENGPKHLAEVAAPKIHLPMWPFRATFFVGVSGKSFLGLPNKDLFSSLDEVPESYRCD